MTTGVFDNTLNLNFNLIEFDFASWHDLEYANWRTLDAYLGTYIGINGIQGPWANGTAYVVGQRVADPVNGKIYQCEVAHTSAASPDTFAEDRTANPTYWSEISLRPVLRGEWATGTLYNAGDFVFTNNGLIYAVAVVSHTSGATFAGDSANWSNIVDGTNIAAIETDAQASADAASTSATNAASSASAASTSESNASSSASAASTSATSASGSATTATTQATNASNSATSASNSATAASSSASAAATSATAAGNAETAAETAQTAAVAARTAAEAARDLSQEWATKPEDQAITGSPGQFSALHWAAKAQASAGNADTLDGLDSTAFAILANNVNIFDGTTGATTLRINDDESGTTNGPRLELTENAGVRGHRFRYQTNTNTLYFENTNNSFGAAVGVFTNERDSAVVDFKATPTVNTVAVSLSNHGHGNASTSTAGFMSPADKTKLDGIATGAEVNAVDSVNGNTGVVVLDAADVGAAATSHTHTIAQVTDLQTTLNGKATLGADTNLFQASGNTLMEIRGGATNDDAELRLMESATLGHRLFYDGGANSLSLQSTANGFTGITTAFSNARGSAVVDFKATPTVNGTTVSLSTHTHSNATTGAAGFMSAADKTKLDALPAKQPVFAQGWRNTTLSIGNNSLIDVTWDSEDDPSSILNGGTGIFTAPTDARFCIASVSIAWASNNSGVRFVELIHGTIARARTRVDPSGPVGEAECSLSAGPFPVSAGDTVFVRVLQNSGGNLNLQAASYNTMAVGFFF